MSTATTTEPVSPDTTTPAAPQVLIELDPSHVAQHPENLRDPGRGIKELTASVAEVGVLVPLIVVPVALVPGHDFPPEVTHVAVDGNRRQAAARAAGLPLPCIVRADLAAAKETARTMAVTGLVRDGLTAAEEAHAVATLFDLKYSAAAISRATGRSKTHLATARKAATLTESTADQVAAYPLTIEQLAVIAQYQDEPDAVAALVQAAEHGQLEHVAAQLRAQQLEDEAVAKRCAELVAQGVTVVQDEPARYGTGPARRLDALRPADTPPGTELEESDHAGCPGHAAYVSADYYEAETTDDEDLPDELDLSIAYLCTDAERYGHWPRYGNRAAHRPTPDGDDNDNDDEASAAAERQARQDEARRAERRALIRLNKEADAAETVRREYLHQCVTVKSRHKAMAAWALSQVVNRDTTHSQWAADYYQNKPTLTQILGADPRTFAAAAPAAAHGMILWTHVCAHEESLPRDAHRQVDQGRAAYLLHLQSMGYVLSPVEQQIIDNTTPDDQQATDEGPADEQPAEPAAGEPAAGEQSPADAGDAEVAAA